MYYFVLLINENIRYVWEFRIPTRKEILLSADHVMCDVAISTDLA